MRNRNSFWFSPFGFWLLLLLFVLSAWVQHVITCISNEQWGFLIAGAIAFPVGMIHGIGIWFGVW